MRSRAVAGMVLGYWGCASTILLYDAVCVSVMVDGEGRGEEEGGKKTVGAEVVQFVNTEGV